MNGKEFKKLTKPWTVVQVAHLIGKTKRAVYLYRKPDRTIPIDVEIMVRMLHHGWNGGDMVNFIESYLDLMEDMKQ